MLKYFLSLLFTVLFVSVCFCSQKEQIDLSAIANYSIIPSNVFVIKNKLFLDFGAKNLDWLEEQIHKGQMIIWIALIIGGIFVYWKWKRNQGNKA